MPGRAISVQATVDRPVVVCGDRGREQVPPLLVVGHRKRDHPEDNGRNGERGDQQAAPSRPTAGAACTLPAFGKRAAQPCSRRARGPSQDSREPDRQR